MADKFCHECQEFERKLTDFFLQKNPSSKDTIKLGKVRDIIERQACPICRLAAWSWKSPYLGRHCPDPTSPISLMETLGTIEYDSVTCEISFSKFFEDLGNLETGATEYSRCVSIVFRGGRGGTFGDFTRDRQFYRLSESKYHEGARYPTARHLSSRVEKANLIREWSGRCEQKHKCGTNNGHLNSSRLRGLLVIDTWNDCLVECPPDCKYVSLSYVWGNHSCPGARRNTIDLLKRTGGLTAWTENIPKTISDAIWLTREIGERYLWVDLLCIVQDDGAVKHTLISAMDQIYSESTFTIMALTGNNANAGIFETKQESLPNGHNINKEITLLAIHETMFRNGRRSQHYKRAWTLQEQLLSQRQVLFVDGMMSFLCTEACWREDIAYEEFVQLETFFKRYYIDSPFDHVFHRGPKKDLRAIKKYLNCVEYYTGRKLTFSSDIMKAFSGIASMLETVLDSPLIFGLPVKYMEWALLWEPRDRHSGKDLFPRRELFPSWSWSGWSGVVHTEDHTTWAPDAEPALSFSPPHTWIEWYYWSIRRRRFVSLGKAVTGHQKDTNSPDLQSLLLDIRDTTLRCPADRAGQLRFSTDAIFLDARNFAESSGSVSSMPLSSGRDGELGKETHLFDRLGRCIGMATITDTDASDSSRGQRYEVLILSERVCKSGDRELPFVNNISGDLEAARNTEFLKTHTAAELGRYPDDMPPELHFIRFPQPWTWSTYNVMLIEWRNDVAYRVGIGWILWEALECSFAPGRQWKEITLG